MQSLAGKTAIVTGANAGLGLQTALQLARRGAHVVLACRDELRGTNAERELRVLLSNEENRGSVEFMKLDLSDLSSVRSFSEQFKASHDRLNLLVNNAGVMGGPFQLTVDGIEKQFATNHLGHFALTARLFHRLKSAAPDARVVNVSSMVHRHAVTFDEDNIVVTDPSKYNQRLVYANSKLCNILFTLELNQRAASSGVIAVACHPGTTVTDLLAKSSDASNPDWFWRISFKLLALSPFRQSCEMGALPTLFAATNQSIRGGELIGPDGWGGLRGYPTLESLSRQAQSRSAGAKLWVLSERLAGLDFNFET